MYIHLAVALVPSRAKVSFNKEKIAFVYDYTCYEHFFNHQTGSSDGPDSKTEELLEMQVSDTRNCKCFA